MNKKLVLSVLSTALVASMASAAMAKPGAGIYVGGDVDKYYSAIPFLDNFDAALDEILDNLENSVFVDPTGRAAKLSDALSADDINSVLKPATEADFEANDYKVVGEAGKVWNPKDETDWTPVVPGELKVESVSSISKTGVTVAITKLTEDLEGKTIEVKDNTGKVVEVNPLNLVINEVEATFVFKTALAADPTGVWTIADISFDADAYAKVDKVNKATTELALYNALTAAGIANLKVENSAAYFSTDKPAAGFKSLTEVQAFVDKVNADKSTDAEKVAQVETLVKAIATNSDVMILNALTPWAQVNQEFIADYKVALAGITTATLFKDIQDDINDVNVNAADTLVDDAVVSAKRADYNKAVAAMSFVRADNPEDSTDKVKANLQASLDLLNLVLNVKEASTAAQFANAYNALVAKVNNKATIGTEVFYTDLRTKYMEATKAQAAGTAETVVTAADIEAEIVKANTAKRAELYNVVANVVDTAGATQTKPADVLKALQGLAAYVPSKTQFDIATVSTTEDRLKAYRAELAPLNALTPATASVTDVTNAIADVKDAIDTVNGTAVGTPLTAIQNFDSTDNTTFPAGVTDPEEALLTHLKNPELALGNVVDANAELYLANEAAFNTAATVGAGTAANAIKAVKALVADLNQVANINKAKSATEVHNALLALGVTDYLNVASVDRLAVAESVLELVQDTAFAGYENKADVTADVATITGDRTTAIAGVNALTPTSDITDVSAALEAVGYKAFNDLSAGDKAIVAEKFAAALVFNDAGTALKAPYKSLTAIKADIDKAIAAQ